MKIRLVSILMTCACVSTTRADFNPVALTPGSYTYAIVVPASAPAPLPYCINVTAGNGVGEGDNTYYEQGLYAPPGYQGSNSGIPIHNTVFTSINNVNMAFLMPPDYTVNNELMIDSTFTSGTLTFNSATTATNLAILCTGGGGALTVNYTVTHSDNSTETGTLSLLDWFNGGSTVAWGANGRISIGGGYDHFNGSSVNNNPPYLYANTITVLGTTPIVSIEFDSPSGNHGNFFAVSGNAAGANWTPIPVNPLSFNVISTVPAVIPYPVTATMDGGTNLAGGNSLNTWFEQGFVPGGITAGLPASGSLFNSQSQSSHHYQMGNYSTNNAILIDINHQVENITLASPASYAALSFLTAGANISGNMTNLCIIQHADGVNETNIFLGYDWFDASHPSSIAFSSSGRVSMQNRTVNNIGNSVPYLFETYFTLADTASPVTNIVVEYLSASSAASTTYVMAISASAGGIAPLILSGPVPATQNWFPGQTATFTVSVSGTAPLTNSWLVQVNGNFVPLADGVDANGSTIYGSSKENLVISNLTAADSGTYEYVAANAFGSQANTATLAVLAPGNSLEWSAINNSGVWDTGSSANWTNLANSSQTVFNAGDRVLFDDTIGVPTTVTVNGTVLPTSVTVNSSTNDFVITGTGSLTGPGSLVKQGTSPLEINCSGGLTGSVSIQGGSIYAGNNCFASISSITITNDSTMDIGGGSFNNPVPVTISDSGFDSQGAIINSDGDYPIAAFNINLTGDATISCSPQRWDLVAGSVTGAHSLTVDGNGGYSMEWNSLTIGANVSNIIFTNGTFGMKYLDSAFKKPATVCIVSSNSQFDFWNGGFNGSLYLMPGAAINIFTGQPLTIANGATLSSISSTVNGSLVIAAGGTVSPSGASTGVATGILTVSGNFTNNGTVVIKLDGSGVNDSIICSSGITYGGTLNLTNVSATPLAIGNLFQVFSATNYSGSFTSIVPATPGAGLAWDTSRLNSSGLLSVTGSRPVISGATVSGGNLVFNVTGGTPGDTLYVLTRTNLLLGNWAPIATNQYGSSGSLSITNAISQTKPQQFFMIEGQ